MGVDRDVFYTPEKIAILPMGFCFPGPGKTGDLPPRPECAIAWRDQLLDQFENLQLTLHIGLYAQNYYFNNPKQSLTDRVQSWFNHPTDQIPLPHPSPRNNIWLKRNAWFEEKLLPLLKKRVFNVIELDQ